MSYIIGSFKILDIGEISIIPGNISNIKVIVELVNNRYRSYIFELQIWGNLTNSISNYYKINDFIIVKGYFSGNVSVVSTQTEESKKIKVPQLTVIKIHLISLNL